MKMGFWMRSSAAVCALTAAACAPAMADDFAVGPATVTLGGFAAAETVNRSRDEQADIGSTFSGIPFSNNPAAHTSEFRMTARQSRLSLLVQNSADADTHVAFYGEFDFMAGPGSANSNESNSFSPRIRNLYGTIGWASSGIEILAGQNWSLVTLNSHGISPRSEVPPATIEAQYVTGFNWARQPQVRITKNWDNQFWLALSIENSQTTIAANAAAASGITVTSKNTAASEFDSTTSLSLNHIPDVVAKAAWEPMIDGARPLHVEAFGIYRDFYDRANVAAGNALGLPASVGNKNVSGGGFGGSITWTAVPKLLDLQATVMNGSGIGRYGSGQLPDVTLNPNGALDPISETTMLFGATLHANPVLDLYAYAGQEEQNAKFFNAGTGHQGLGNPAYNLTGCFTEGGTCSPNIHTSAEATAGFWWRAYTGKYGSARFGLQYSYNRLTAFPGVGGKPDTDDSMIFTSIRYYPF